MFSIGRKTKYMAELMARKVFSGMFKDTNAESNLFKMVIGVFIVAILIGALIPTAITSISNANKSGWDAGVTATYDALPILIVVAVIAVVAGIAYKAFNE